MSWHGPSPSCRSQNAEQHWGEAPHPPGTREARMHTSPGAQSLARPHASSGCLGSCGGGGTQMNPLCPEGVGVSGMQCHDGGEQSCVSGSHLSMHSGTVNDPGISSKNDLHVPSPPLHSGMPGSQNPRHSPCSESGLSMRHIAFASQLSMQLPSYSSAVHGSPTRSGFSCSGQQRARSGMRSGCSDHGMHFCMGSVQSLSSSRQSPPGPGGVPVVESTPSAEPLVLPVGGSTNVVLEPPLVVGLGPDSSLPSLLPLSPQPARRASTQEKEANRRMRRSLAAPRGRVLVPVLRAVMGCAWQARRMQIHPVYRDPRRRGQLQALLASAFKTLPVKVDAARALGFDWDAVTTPFVELHDDVIVSHVGVLDVPLRLDGRAVRVAGIHAVCTLPAYRRRGFYRRAMERALAFVEPRWELAQLYTDEPALYEPFGFRVVPTRRWDADRPDALAPGARPIDAQGDLPALVDALSRRTPLSHVYASVDDGWLLGIDALLSTGDLSLVWRVPELDVFVAGRLEGERFTLCDVIATELPDWSVLAPRLPGRGPVRLAFTPDRYPDARARLLGPADDGCYMVRGPFPLDGRDFAVPPLCQH